MHLEAQKAPNQVQNQERVKVVSEKRNMTKLVASYMPMKDISLRKKEHD